jgi:hypothetical protein
MHRLRRGARLAVRVATAAIGRVLLATMSSLRVLERLWAGREPTLAATCLGLRKTFFHKLGTRRYTLCSFFFLSLRWTVSATLYGFDGMAVVRGFLGLVPQKRRDFIQVFWDRGRLHWAFLDPDRHGM